MLETCSEVVANSVVPFLTLGDPRAYILLAAYKVEPGIKKKEQWETDSPVVGHKKHGTAGVFSLIKCK
jgi:hypothetical protein